MNKQELKELIQEDIRAIYDNNISLVGFIKIHIKTTMKLIKYKIKSRSGMAVPYCDKTKYFKQIISYLGGKINVSSRESYDFKYRR